MGAYDDTMTTDGSGRGSAVPTLRAAASVALAGVGERARDYANSSTSTNTRRAYRADWADFTAWCQTHRLDALPAVPATVALYIADQAAHCKPSTIQRRLAAISQAHKLAHLSSPTADPAVRAVNAGIRRTHGTAPDAKAPAVTDELRRMLSALPATTRGVRDRALLLMGFAGAFRRSELVALNVADVRRTEEGLVVTIRRSKTDQEGQGRTVGVPYGSDPLTCPVRALAGWFGVSGVREGALFRTVGNDDCVQAGRLSDRGVARAVQRGAQAAGLDPATYAGHSLRAGLATSAAKAGVSERAIMAQTGHKSLPMVRKYIRDGNLWTENAAAKVGL